MKKLSSTEAELKKRGLWKKACNEAIFFKLLFRADDKLAKFHHQLFLEVLKELRKVNFSLTF